MQALQRERKGRPFVINCELEVDDKGRLCEDWARGGLCNTHRPTMFLFCRRTCLCVGPPETNQNNYEKNAEGMIIITNYCCRGQVKQELFIKTCSDCILHA
ncbi:unnamed protein product [Thelazia callipaeda]|uniref:ShKT domain-containing protein n=1 Tax=Thelazia callipaeda TaxID=103827 RepID=A0A0N5CZT7_THECL|nr:unnamed protein product [Thelazia callipaeda]